MNNSPESVRSVRMSNQLDKFSCSFRMSVCNIENLLDTMFDVYLRDDMQAMARDLFEEVDLTPTFDVGGNITDLALTDIGPTVRPRASVREQEEFLESIKEFVEPGSYVEFMGYNGLHWRCLFKDGMMRFQTPTITWD